MAKIGIAPCEAFNLTALAPAAQAALKDLRQQALDKIAANKNALGTVTDRWVMTTGVGAYGTDDMKRGVIGASGWPANLQGTH
jgi:hypothetical protein